jgi:hypothetical protein
MGIHKQNLDLDGLPILVDRKCPHGLRQDRRGNSNCESCFDDSMTEHYLLGISVGWEQIQKWLKKKAGDAFADRNDERAHLYRTLADEAEERHKGTRAEYEKHRAGASGPAEPETRRAPGPGR